MMSELVSVVIPIYNVEKYLCQCVDSVLAQSYTNIEVILVDDGATDSCPQICDDYEKKDVRVKVIHKRNGGLSDARNAGLRIALGEYICFFDSDDVVHNDIIAELYRACTENKADISTCFFERFTEERSGNNENKIQNQDCTGKELISRIYNGQGEKIAFVAWNKLYKKDLFEKHNILYPVGKHHEDTYTTYKLLYYAKSVCIVPKELYYYRVRQGSIMNSVFSLKRLEDIEAREEAIEFYSNQAENALLKLAVNDYFGSSVRTYGDAHRSTCKEAETKIINDCYSVWNKYSSLLEWKKRFFYGLFLKYPNMISNIYLKIKQ